MAHHQCTSSYNPLKPLPAFYTTDEWRTLRAAIISRDKGTCQYCGEPAETADHVRPRYCGGSDDADNLVASCHACNAFAGSREFASFEEKRAWLLERMTRDEPPTEEEPKYVEIVIKRPRPQRDPAKQVLEMLRQVGL
jgi:5-methylcytosine-specific restriction endonuclease McrA